MIDQDVLVVDLYPLTWRNLGQVMRIDELSSERPASPQTLSVLHEAGRILKTIAPQGLNIQLEAQINDPQQVARDLYHLYADKIDGVQIFDKSSLSRFSDTVQRLDWQQLSSGDFYLRAFEIARMETTGIVYYPTTCAPYLYTVLSQAQRLIASIPDGQTLVLGIFNEGKPYFTLILKVENQKIKLCTSFEYLQPYGLNPATVPSSVKDAEFVVSLVSEHVGTVAHALFCDYPTFEAWRNNLISQNVWHEGSQ